MSGARPTDRHPRIRNLLPAISFGDVIVSDVIVAQTKVAISQPTPPLLREPPATLARPFLTTEFSHVFGEFR